MSKIFESRLLWGGLLILGGGLFLLENLGWIEFGGLFWGLLLGFVGIFFLTMYFANRLTWWPIIPGLTLIGIALLILLGELAPQAGQIWGASIVLASIGLSFIWIYFSKREMWWAIIPGGVLLSLAIAIGVGEYFQGDETGGLFMLGLGITFAVLTLVQTPDGRMWWPWIPAGILSVIGIFLIAAAGNIFSYIWPFALIIGGGIIIYQTLRKRS